MALTLGDNFSYQGAKPLDGRLKYDTVANMKAVADATMYDGCMAYCTATGKTYQWKSTNTVDETLGKWREFESGGGGTSDYTDLENKPQINSHTLTGNQTGHSLGLQNESLSQAISICGTSASNVEDALEELTKHFNVKNGVWTFTSNMDFNRHSFEAYYYSLNANVSHPGGVAYPPLPFGLTKTPSKMNYIAFKVGTDSDGSNPANVRAYIICFEYFTYQGNDYCKLYARNGYYTGSSTGITDWVEIGGVEAGTGLEVSNGTMSIKEFSSGAMDDVIDELPEGNTLVGIAQAFNKGDIYSTSEKMIGQWVDGKPLYQKTVSCGALPNSTTKNTAHGISNLDHVWNVKGIFYGSSNASATIPYVDINAISNGVNITIGASNIAISTARDYSSFNVYVTLQYTKTTDSAVAIGEDTEYSTNEKIVGTWIDGKKIYQRTFTGTLAKTSTQGTEVSADVSMGVSVDKYVDANGWAYNSSTGTFQKFNLFNNNASAGYGLRMTCNNNLHSSKANKIVLANSWFTVDTTYYLTVQYTKA